MVVWRGVQGGCGVFYQIYSKSQLLILQSYSHYKFIIVIRICPKNLQTGSY